MTRQQIAVLTAIVAQARGADMDIGMGVNVLAALLTERTALVEALQDIVARNEIQGWFNLDMARAALKLAGVE